MLSDLIIQLTTGQSIKVNGKKIGPQIKEDKTSTCPDARENCILMSKTAPSLVPPQRAAFATEWSGSAAAAQALCLCQRGLLQSCSHRLLASSGRRRSPGNLRPPKGDKRTPSSGPAPRCWQACGWLCGERAPVWARSWNGNYIQTTSSSCNSFWGQVFNIFFLFWPWW